MKILQGDMELFIEKIGMIVGRFMMRIMKLGKYRLKAQVEKDEGLSGEGQSPRVEKDEGPSGEG